MTPWPHRIFPDVVDGTWFFPVHRKGFSFFLRPETSPFKKQVSRLFGGVGFLFFLIELRVSGLSNGSPLTFLLLYLPLKPPNLLLETDSPPFSKDLFSRTPPGPSFFMLARVVFWAFLASFPSDRFQFDRRFFFVGAALLLRTTLVRNFGMTQAVIPQVRRPAPPLFLLSPNRRRLVMLPSFPCRGV